jgi:surface polysaccharide O-acyltransferase-like enzyme
MVLYLAYVMGALVLLYLASTWIEQRSLAGRQLAVMARYSLLAYMGQMGILQAMRWLMPDSPLLRSFPVVFCVALAVLLVSLHIVDYLRRNYALADKAYHAVFG